MSDPKDAAPSGDQTLAVLLAAAMFVLVVDTSLMNVSISAVVRDLDTTVSGVQSAIALEALVSAAFILIGSKVGDLIGRKRAYVLGLLAYATGALAMTLAQGLTAVIVFWAIIGGLGASLLLPAMQSLVHGNFEGAAQRRAYALVGAAAAIAAAVGPLLGGFITTYLSWRVAFGLEVVIIAVVLSGIRRVHDAPYTGAADGRPGRCRAVGLGDGRPGPRHPGVAGGRRVRAPDHGGRRRRPRAPWSGGSSRRKRAGRPALVDPDLFDDPDVPARHLPADAAADRPRWRHDRAADLPPDGPGVQRDGGRPVPRTAVAQHVRGRHPRGPPGRPLVARAASSVSDSLLLAARHCRAAADRPARRLRVAPGHSADRGRLRSRPPRLAAQQLHPGPDLRRARQRGRRDQLRRRVVRPVLRPGLRRGHHAGDAVRGVHEHGRRQRGPPARRQGTRRRDAPARRRGDEQHRARGAAGRPARRTSRTRSCGSTPRPPAGAAGGVVQSRSSPRCSVWPTRSGWSGSPSPSRPATPRGWRSAERASATADTAGGSPRVIRYG